MSHSGDSRRIAERSPDHRVEACVRRHLARRYDKPIQAHNQRAFDWLCERVGSPASIVLDAGCGTGESTLQIARRHPDAWVVGVDKSAHRLERTGAAADRGRQQDRVMWLRADLVDLWRLAAAAGWRVRHHYLLYPNPWPKPSHLQRRWHTHPVFGTLVGLSDAIVLRTNWRAYAVEFGHALSVVGVSYTLGPLPGEDLSPFERKYRASGHPLWHLTARPGSKS